LKEVEIFKMTSQKIKIEVNNQLFGFEISEILLNQ